MSKTRRQLREVDAKFKTDTEASLDAIFGPYYTSGINIAREVTEKAQNIETVPLLFPTIMSKDETDGGLSAGYKAGFGLTPECTITEAVEVIDEKLGGLVMVTHEVLVDEVDADLREFEKECMKAQEWWLPAVRISYIPKFTS